MCIDVLIQSYGYNEIIKNEEQFQCVSSVLGLGLGLCPRLKGLTGHDSEASYTLQIIYIGIQDWGESVFSMQVTVMWSNWSHVPCARASFPTRISIKEYIDLPCRPTVFLYTYRNRRQSMPKAGIGPTAMKPFQGRWYLVIFARHND